MYGLISKLDAVDGRREDLARILVEGSAEMPGCLSYFVAEDTTDPNGVWVTEIWHSRADHERSLSLPAVRAVMEKGRPLIAGRHAGRVIDWSLPARVIGRGVDDDPRRG